LYLKCSFLSFNAVAAVVGDVEKTVESHSDVGQMLYHLH
jgi:hypothetical protein